MNYRKLNENELKSLKDVLIAYFKEGQSYQNDESVKEFVKKYYPTSAAYCTIQYNSEYNDSTWDNVIQTIVVFDKEGNEVTPIKGKELEARKTAARLSCVEESDEMLEDKTINIKQPRMPDVYVPL